MMFRSIKKFSKEEWLFMLLSGIEQRTTRHKRATDEYEILIRDLEFIEDQIKEVRKVMKSDKDEYYA